VGPAANNPWRAGLARAGGQAYRQCANRRQDGLITVNIAEADDDERERRR